MTRAGLYDDSQILTRADRDKPAVEQDLREADAQFLGGTLKSKPGYVLPLER